MELRHTVSVAPSLRTLGDALCRHAEAIHEPLEEQSHPSSEKWGCTPSQTHMALWTWHLFIRALKPASYSSTLASFLHAQLRAVEPNSRTSSRTAPSS
jgi:hypothetical protein